MNFKLRISGVFTFFVVLIGVAIVLALLNPKWIDFMVQGLFVGIGVGVAEYIKERHIKGGLTRIEDGLRGVNKDKMPYVPVLPEPKKVVKKERSYSELEKW